MANDAKEKKQSIEEFSPGDIVRVHISLKEDEKIHKHLFEGTVISCRGEGMNKTFTVRKLVGGYGVEQIFPLRSPIIEKIEVVKKGKLRRAKLYYLRKK